MAKSNLQFKGFKEVQQIFDHMGEALAPKVVLKVLTDGAQPLIEQAKANAPVGTGDLQRSIGVIPGKGGLKGEGVYVGPRRGGKDGDGWQAHLVEYGVAPRIVKKPTKKFYKKGTQLGNMPAHPFLRPAWDQKHQEVEQRIGAGFKEVLKSKFKGVK
jgi:HK97 gp10 family phage protein